MWYTDDLVPISLDDVNDAAKRCNAWRVFLHWTAGHYGQAYEDYHINIDQDGSLYCIGDLDFDEKKSHTWKQNSGAIGIAMCCAYGATTDGESVDFGNEPPTQEQIDACAMIMAVLAKNGILLENMRTHYEQAILDGYGVPVYTWQQGIYQGDPDCRWDLMLLPDSAQNGKLIGGGDCLRGKARWFMQHIN